jgi:citrate synthase
MSPASAATPNSSSNPQAASASTPAMTWKKGLEDVVATDTKISFIDGEKGVLEYVGIAIDDLARNSTFEETTYLLWNGKLPTKAQLEAFSADLRSRYDLPAGLIESIKRTPKTAQPMHVLRTLISELALYDADPNKNDAASARSKALNVLAQAPTIVAYFDRHRRSLPFVAPDKSMNFAENFLTMLNGQRPTPTMAKAFDVCMILHADHGLNNSTFSARVIISTMSDVYSALTGAVGSLRGPLHGGANEDVMKMLAEIPTVQASEAYIQNKLATKAKIAGFGHRVYKAYDPRATYLKTLAKQLSEDTGNQDLYAKSTAIEQVMLREKAAKGIYPNVDFYSATTYHSIGLKLDLFTPMFALSRIAGWSGHILEQLADNRLYRPDAAYNGPHNISYSPIASR